jgi:DSF synthase
MLSRKIGPTNAEKMVLSGKLYSAEQLFEMGIVDILAEDNQGVLAVYNHINKENHSKNAIDAMRKVRDHCSPITLEELEKIVDIWTDSAMNLTAKDIRMMDRLLSKQTQRSRVAAA